MILTILCFVKIIRYLAIKLVSGFCAFNMIVLAQAQQLRPNILFIMSDDHTSQAFGVYGSRLASLDPTPTIDRIAKEGMLFENVFCTNAICTPSRATIMTGQYGHINGVKDLNGSLSVDRQYLAHEMKSLGYETAMVGKWHLKEAPESFDYYNVLPGQGKYHNPILYSRKGGEKMKLWFSKEISRDVNVTQYEGHSSDIITDISLDWLKEGWDKTKPFFLMHHFKAPHDFFEYARRYEHYLEDVEIPEPASMYYNGNNGSSGTRGVNNNLVDTIGSSIGKRNIIRNMGMHMNIDPNISDPEYTSLAYQEYLKRYLRCVKGVDDNVKRIFNYLEQAGIMDNTIIIYTGDQGFMLGEHDYIDKRWMYEESLRMPFLVRFPQMIPAGSRTDAIINNADFAPTIIDLAGGKVPDYMQGSSFAEICSSGKEPNGWKNETYYRYWMHMAHKHNNPAHFGIRTKNYKLIFFYGRDYIDRDDGTQSQSSIQMSQFATPPSWEFYDLRMDPEEMDNRYGQANYKDIISNLKERLESVRENVGENDADYPEIEKVITTYWN